MDAPCFQMIEVMSMYATVQGIHMCKGNKMKDYVQVKEVKTVGQ